MIATANPSWGQIIDGQKQYPLHQGQADILQSRNRFKAAIAGTGGGKTALGPIWVMNQISRCQQERDLTEEPVRGLIVAPTYPIMARATAPTFVEMLEGTIFEGRFVESKNRYYLPDEQGLIWLLSADNPKGIEGGQFDWCWIDEGGQLKYDAWIAIQGRLGLKEAPALITTTPYGRNWLYSKIYLPFVGGDKTYYVRQWPSVENPKYPREEYDRMKRTLHPSRAAMRYDGKFMKMIGLVYPDMSACVVPHTDPPDGELVGGIDFGWNNPFAALGATLYIDEDGRDILYIWYERYKRYSILADHAAGLPSAGNVRWWADPSRPDSIQELRIAGHVVRKAYNDIQLGIDAVSSRIATGRLKISNKCKALIAEADQYKYPEKDDEVIGEKPIDEFNHALDALRYLIMGIDKRKIANAA